MLTIIFVRFPFSFTIYTDAFDYDGVRLRGGGRVGSLALNIFLKSNNNARRTDGRTDPPPRPHRGKGAPVAYPPYQGLRSRDVFSYVVYYTSVASILYNVLYYI